MREPSSFFAEMQSRLLRVADEPPFRFKDTKRADAEQYLRASRRFVGYSEEQIQAAEKALGVTFPAVYRAFLGLMGVQRGGDLFCGLDLPSPGEERAFAAKARQILRSAGTGLELPSRAIVVYLREGYIFACMSASGGDDAPVLEFNEDEAEYRECAPSFADLVLAWVSNVERGHKAALESGGWFLSINQKFGYMRHYPARASGVRPVDCADEFSD